MEAPVADVQAKLDDIVALVQTARAMPMSASCIVNRADVIARLDELRAMLPTELQQARSVIRDRDDVVDDGRRQADQILQEAYSERARMLSTTEVVQEAQREADALLTNAAADADRMRMEVDDYVDGKLANFEVVLQKTLRAVERGRAKLAGRMQPGRMETADMPAPELPDEDVEPLPR